MLSCSNCSINHLTLTLAIDEYVDCTFTLGFFSRYAANSKMFGHLSAAKATPVLRLKRPIVALATLVEGSVRPAIVDESVRLVLEAELEAVDEEATLLLAALSDVFDVDLVGDREVELTPAGVVRPVRAARSTSYFG